MDVIHWDKDSDGPLSEGALKSAMEAEGYMVMRYVYPPGTTFSPHRHGEDKLDAVVSGTFHMELGSESVDLEAGDRLFVPSGAVHSARVVGDVPVVSLDGVRHH